MIAYIEVCEQGPSCCGGGYGGGGGSGGGSGGGGSDTPGDLSGGRCKPKGNTVVFSWCSWPGSNGKPASPASTKTSDSDAVTPAAPPPPPQPQPPLEARHAALVTRLQAGDAK